MTPTSPSGDKSTRGVPILPQISSTSNATSSWSVTRAIGNKRYEIAGLEIGARANLDSAVYPGLERLVGVFLTSHPYDGTLVTSGCAQGRVKAAESVQILPKRGATFPAVRAIAIASHEHNHAQRCCFWLVTKIVLKPQILRNKRRNFVSTCESRLNLAASLPEAAHPFCAVDYLPDNNQVDREDDESRQKTDREHYSVLLEIGQCDESDENSKKDVAQRNRS